MMFDDLTTLIDQVANPSRETYRSAILEENLLGKRTQRTRITSWKYLNQLYGLSIKESRNAGFYALWDAAPDARPQLALLRALERDSLLRLAAPWIVAQPPGQVVTPAALADALTRQGVVYSEKTLRSISQNLLSSWAQAGWLSGKITKRRAEVQWRPAAAAYLLHAAYLGGKRGIGLYDTPLASLLGLDAEQLDTLAFTASQERLLTYRRLADIVEITFPGWDSASGERTA